MEPFYNQIEAYLLGELDRPAQRDFEKALRQTPRLRASVEKHREMILRLRALHLHRKVKAALH